MLATAFFLLINVSARSQDSLRLKNPVKYESGTIDFVSQWPSAEHKLHKKSFTHKLRDVLLGDNTPELNKPVSLVASDPNTFWVLDQKNNAVFRVEKGKEKIPHYLNKSKFHYNSLVGVCQYTDHKILFTDSYQNKIYILDPDSKKCSVLNDSLILEKPTGIAFSKITNEIWVTETGKHRLVVLNNKGEILRTIGNRGTSWGNFNFPTHLWIDNQGQVYVVDAMNFRIQVFNKEGLVISVFGSNGDATGYFASPKGIATDSFGHIYVADALFHAVQIFDIKGNFLYSFGSQGQDEGQFWMPSGVYIDEHDRIYVSDTYNSRVQIFHLITGGEK